MKSTETLIYGRRGDQPWDLVFVNYAGRSLHRAMMKECGVRIPEDSGAFDRLLRGEPVIWPANGYDRWVVKTLEVELPD
jgi:hypothetical protein